MSPGHNILRTDFPTTPAIYGMRIKKEGEFSGELQCLGTYGYRAVSSIF